MAGEKSIMCPTIERRTEVVEQLIEEISNLAIKKSEIEELKNLIHQLPPVDLGHLSSSIIALKVEAMKVVDSMDEVIVMAQDEMDSQLS